MWLRYARTMRMLAAMTDQPAPFKPSPEAQAALAGVIAALGPIANDREACRRVLDAASALFAPCKEFSDALLETLEGPIGQMAMPLFVEWVSLQTKPAQTKSPCNCGPIRGVRTTRAQRMDPSQPDVAIYRRDINAYLAADGATWLLVESLTPPLERGDSRVAKYAGAAIGGSIAATFNDEPWFTDVEVVALA